MIHIRTNLPPFGAQEHTFDSMFSLIDAYLSHLSSYQLAHVICEAQRIRPVRLEEERAARRQEREKAVRDERAAWETARGGVEEQPDGTFHFEEG